MVQQQFIDKVREYAERKGIDETYFETDVPGLFALVYTQPTQFEAFVYESAVSLIMQGRKRTVIGDRQVDARSGDTCIISHGLTVFAKIIEASPERPYIALVLKLDLAIVRSLIDQIDETESETEAVRAYEVDHSDAAFLNAMERYFNLNENPLEAKVMAPLVLKELHFRMLMAPHGGMLRKLQQRGSHASRISNAITLIRQNYLTPIVVGDLAETVGMSPSSFHAHFKSIIGLSPLQYQKDLRLMEARRLLLEGTHTVSSTAFETGYESPTQFSREYARKFGVPPRHDLSPRADSV